MSSGRCVVAALFVGLLSLAGGVWGDEFPRELVDWVPVVPDPVFRGEGGDAWDRSIRERGYVLLEKGTFHLWYTGYNTDRSRRMLLGHATSSDGLSWRRDPANPVFRGAWTEDVFVVRDGPGYLMVAEGQDDVAHQLEGSDPSHWTDLGRLDVRKVDGTPISPGPYGTPSLWRQDGVWHLFYERGDLGVWLATSRDRKVWTNVQDTPVIGLGPAAYDRAAVALNQVVKRGGWYYGFYHANASRPWREWSCCVARSADLVHWEKYPGNPIVGDNRSSPILVGTPAGDRLYTMHPEVRVYRPR